jgi:hypothetical protein
MSNHAKPGRLLVEPSRPRPYIHSPNRGPLVHFNNLNKNTSFWLSSQLRRNDNEQTTSTGRMQGRGRGLQPHHETPPAADAPKCLQLLAPPFPPSATRPVRRIHPRDPAAVSHPAFKVRRRAACVEVCCACVESQMHQTAKLPSQRRNLWIPSISNTISFDHSIH